MKTINLILVSLLFASSCQHRAPASIEISPVAVESCSPKAELNKKTRYAKNEFKNLLHLIRKKDRSPKEDLEVRSKFRKWESKAFTKDASPVFTQKVINDLNKLQTPFVIDIIERELIDKTFDNRDHSVELKRYLIQIRENIDIKYRVRILCQSTYNCLNDQDFRSACTIEEP